MLGVPVSQLRKIELAPPERFSQMQVRIAAVLARQHLTDPTWNEIVQALEKTDQLALAAQIKHDYLWSAGGAISEEESMLCVCVQ